jgi:hypothetical protein
MSPGETVEGKPVSAHGLSPNGSTILADEEYLGKPPSDGKIVTILFAGGPAKTLVNHAVEPSWNLW